MTDIRGNPRSEPQPGSQVLRRADTVAPYVATAAAAVVYSLLALRRVWVFQANAFDAGLTDNLLYKVSSGLGNVSGLTGDAIFVGRPLIHVLGLPLYWINSDLGYPGLLVFQAVSVAMVGLAAWLISDAVGVGRGKKYAALLFVLASPAAYWAIITELHMTGLSMGLVAMTVAGAYRRWRLSYFWIVPLLAAMARMEVAVTVIVVGFLLWRVSRPHARVTVAVGVATAAVLGTVMLALPTPGGSIGVHLSYLGIDSFTQLPIAILRHPLEVTSQLLSPVFLASIFIWLMTIGVVMPLRASRWLLIAVPTLLIAAIGSPVFADIWYQHYWNYVFVGASIAFALSLAVWSWSGKGALGLVAAVVIVAWTVPSLIFGVAAGTLPFSQTVAMDPRIVAIAESGSGALSAPTKLVLPGAHREWVYLFPSPFACRAEQFFTFTHSGPPPDVVITEVDWEETVADLDADSVRRVLSGSYRITDKIGPYTVWGLIPGASPTLVDECEMTPAD